jgi:hypothetical protein
MVHVITSSGSLVFHSQQLCRIRAVFWVGHQPFLENTPPCFALMRCAGQGGGMPVLAILRHDEVVRLDPDPLAALYSELGENGAERIVCRAIEELASRLTEMSRHADQSSHAALIRSGRTLSKVAEQIGMATLARVAQDVIDATEAGDHAGQAATLARLVRIGDRSLTAVWDLRDMTV